MALNIKNVDVERLAAEVATLAGETKTEAVRRALLERRARLQRGRPQRSRAEDFREFLAREVWATIPAAALDGTTSKAEREQILGYGPEGV